jgi:hypothetical protein
MAKYKFVANAVMFPGDTKDDVLAELVRAISEFTEPIRFRADKFGDVVGMSCVFAADALDLPGIEEEVRRNLQRWGIDNVKIVPVRS